MLRAAVLALTVTGCSLAFTRNPPPPCATSAVAPIADIATAVVATLATIYLATDDETSLAIGAGAVAAGTVTSAVIGYRRVSACRDAKAGAR